MSLIRVRRERREEHRGPNRPPRLWRLVLGIIIVGLLLWWLGTFG
ncbi:MAG TPA: hypothetical protein VK929_17635 [Longimicrobiales bacterium]|nr:hypothetical protein [Longimicrobiales bacterium]